MTKQEFLNGKSFKLNYDYSDTTTYRCDKDGKSLIQEYRTSEGKVVLEDSLLNIDKIGSKMITGYTFVLDSKIVKKIRFEDMELYDGGDE
jgi:hypothetical protein